MNSLFSSQHFALVGMQKGGDNKKDIYGILKFNGLPSLHGNAREVLAIEDGIVLAAECDYNIYSRKHRLGQHITVTGHDGATVTYARLDSRNVKEGDVIHAGQVIGTQKSNEPLVLEFRKSGRRIDGCWYLRIKPKPQTFRPPASSDDEAVCWALGIGTQMRTYINAHPLAPEFWCRIRKKLEHFGDE